MAGEQDYVGFLVAHGLSEQSINQISSFEGDGLKVAYLTDCDDGGRKLQNALKKSKVENERIFNLPGSIGADIVKLEDLISTEVLVDAFNALLYSYYPNENEIQVSDISTEDKALSIKKLAVDRNMSESGVKVPLAYEILSLVNEDPTLQIIDNKYLVSLKELYKNISTLMVTCHEVK